MSRPAIDTITCKGCGGQQQFTSWESLNVTLDPERKRGLVNGDLTRFVCEKCGWSSEVAYPLLYHDMEKHLMIWLIPPGGDIPPTGFSLARRMKDYNFRRVSTRNELIEKVLIFDAGLDDRIVECFKLVIQVQSATDGKPIPETLFFLHVTQAEPGEQLIAFEQPSLQGSQCLELPLQSLIAVRDMLADKLPPPESEHSQWLQVDAAYAKSVLSNL